MYINPQDRFVELMMKDLRMWLGKSGTSHTGTLLERCALTLVQRKRDRATSRRAYTGGTKSLPNNKDIIEIDAIFCEAFVFAMDCNFFGEGPPHHCNRRGPYVSRDMERSVNYEPGEEGFSILSNKSVLVNKLLLSIFSIGDSRLRRYFEKYTKDGTFFTSSYRSEDEAANDGVSLKTVEPLRQDAEKEMKSKIERSTSTDYKKIDLSYNKDELKIDLQVLYNYYKDNYDQNLDNYYAPNGDSKAQNICKIITLRRWVLERNPLWKEATERRIRDEWQQSQEDLAIESIMEKELQLPFLTLEHGSKYVNIDLIYKFKRDRVENSDDNNIAFDGDNEEVTSSPTRLGRVSIGLGTSAFSENWENAML